MRLLSGNSLLKFSAWWRNIAPTIPPTEVFSRDRNGKNYTLRHHQPSHMHTEANLKKEHENVLKELGFGG